MGILSDFFVATREDALAYEERLGGVPDGTYQLVEGNGLTALEVGVLWAILDKVEWDPALHEFPEAVANEDVEAESWLQVFPDDLVIRLVQSSEADMQGAAKIWSESEEMHGLSTDDCSDLVRGLQRLARISQVTGNDMYLWLSL